MSKETKYCSNCGAEIDAKAEICPECGVRVEVMPKFVKMLNFTSTSGPIDIESDSEEVNEVLTKLQEKGAEIVEIKGEVAGSVRRRGGGSTHMVYVVYEAPSPIEIEEDSGGVF